MIRALGYALLLNILYVLIVIVNLVAFGFFNLGVVIIAPLVCGALLPIQYDSVRQKYARKQPTHDVVSSEIVCW